MPRPGPGRCTLFPDVTKSNLPDAHPRLLQLLGLVHKSFRFRLSKMPPSYCAGRVKQEFGDSGDVAVILASVRNQQIIAADHLGFAIGKQGKCEFGLAGQLP